MSDRSRDLIAVVLFVAVSAAHVSPLFGDRANWGILDWDFQLHHHAVQRITILEHAEIPLWNPYNRSGNPMLAHPESRFLTPTFALTLLFGEVVALKLEIWLFLVFGMIGAYLFLRKLGADRLGSWTGGVLFMMSGSYALHLSVGHIMWLSQAYLPWAFLFHDRAVKEPRFALYTGIVLVLTLFGGSPYPMAIMALALSVYSLFTVILDKAPALPHLRALSLTALSTVLIGAIKIIPTTELMLQYPRNTPAPSGYSFTALFNALFDRDQRLFAAFAERPIEFNGTPMHEGMYIGILCLIPLFFGVRAFGLRMLAFLTTGILFFWFSLGQHAPVDFWGLLHRLPVFDNMRMVQRFGFVGLFVIATFVGLGIKPLRRFVESRGASAQVATVFAAGFAAVIALDLHLVGGPLFGDAFPTPPPDSRTLERLAGTDSSAFLQLSDGPRYGPPEDRARSIVRQGQPLSALYPTVLMGRGNLTGYPMLTMESSAVSSDSPRYRGEVYLAGTPGKATLQSWSPNRMVIAGNATAAGKLIVNQNFAPGWRVRGAPSVVTVPEAREGLIAVPVSGGEFTYELEYRPTSFVIGAWVSLCTVGALATLAAWRRFRRPT